MAQRFDKLNLRTSLVIGRTGHLDGAYPLDVWGQSRIRTGDSGGFTANASHDDLIIEGSANTGLQLFSPNTSYQYIAFGDTDGSNSGYIRYYHGTNEMRLRTNGSDNLTITGGGNVGIGTTTPAYKLDIDAGGSQGAVNSRLTRNFGRARFHGVDIIGYDDEVMWIIGNNSSTNTELVIGNSWDWDRSVSFKYTPNATGSASGGLQIGQLSKNNANWTHGFTALHTNGSERLRIDSSGNVGIGTTAPGQKLDVNGTIRTNSTFQFYNTGGAAYSIGAFDASYYRFFTSGTERVRVDANGNVGIGTTSPDEKLHVSGNLKASNYYVSDNIIHTGDADTQIIFGTNTQTFQVGGTNSITINSTGVGIFDTSPSFGLDVNSSARFTGTLYSNNTLRGNSLLIGSTSAAQPRIDGFYMQSNPETGVMMAHPYLMSDLASFVRRGGVVTITGLTTPPTNHDTLFRPDAEIWGTAASNYTGSEFVMELSNVDGVQGLSYGTYCGIAFGNSGWAPATLKIEWSTDDGLNWTTALDSSTKSDFYYTRLENGASVITNIKFTIGQPTSALRITNIFATDYAGKGSSLYHLSTDGGTVYGSVSVLDITTEDQINIKRAGVAAQTVLQQTGTGLIMNAPNGYHPLVIKHNSSELYRFTNTGNLGIGTTSPAEDLHIGNNNPVIQIGTINSTTGNSKIQFFSGNNGTFNGYAIQYTKDTGVDRLDFIDGGGTAKVSFQNGGNVGIGTTSPGAKLEVDGTLKASGAVTLSNYASGLLQVDASGVVSVDSSSYSTFSGDYADLTNKPSIPVSGTDFDPVGTDNSTDVTLAAVTGNYLTISGQVITAGTVPVSLGGTGATTAAAARTNLGVDPAGTDNSTNVTLVTTNHDYLSLSGQAITLNSINLDDINGGATAGILKTDAGGNISVDTTSYSTFSGDYDDLTNKPTLGTAASSAATDFVAVTGDTMSGVLNLVQTNATPLNISTAHSSYTAVAIKNTGTGNAGIYFDAQDGDLTGSDYGFIGQNNAGYMEYHVGASSPEPYHIFSTGNVGIGTAAPNVKLEIKGNASENVQLRLQTDGSATEEPTILFRRNSIAYGEIKYRADGGGSQGIHITDYRSDASNIIFKTAGSNERMRISHTGNVGIGTTSPTSQLTISDPTSPTLEFNRQGSTANGWIKTTDSSQNVEAAIQMYGNEMRFYTNGISNQRMVINSSGNVGIGTTTPGAKLEVAGNTLITGNANVNAQVRAGYQVSTGDARVSAGDGRTGSGNAYVDLIGDTTYSTYGLRVQRAGGANASSYISHRGTGTMYIRTLEAAAMHFQTGSTDKMVISSGGNVGIGTTNPQAKLEVNGSVRFSTITSGILSANASGDISVTSVSSLVQDNIYSPKGWKLTGSTYTGGGQNITSSSTASHSGTTPVTRTNNTTFTINETGYYEIRYQFVAKNNYADRCVVGAQVTDSGNNTFLGSRSFEYLRYTTYGEYATIQATFYATIDSGATVFLKSAIRSGSLNYTLDSETGANAGHISFRLIKEI